MKKILYIVTIVASFFTVLSCVDDYEDANPPRLKDGPYFKVSLSDGEVTGGESITFSIDVIDAPGGIDSVSISNPQQLGSYTINNLASVRGQTTGEITGTFVAPTTFEGDLNLNFEVFDSQQDDKGEDAKKGASVRKTLAITFPEGASDFTINLPSATIVRGESFDFTIEIADAPGGVDSIYATIDNGEVTFDPASYQGILGDESGTVTATYTADEEFVGDVEIFITVIDQLQKRFSMKAATVTAVYQFEAPTVTLTIDQEEFKAFTGIGFEVTIDAPGTIDSVYILTRALNINEPADTIDGATELDEDELGDAIGATSATINGTFKATEKDYYEITAFVVDEQGRTTSSVVEVLVRPCATADIAGEYTAVSSGESGSEPTGPYSDLEVTVEIAGAEGNVFEVSDLSFGLFEVQGFDPEPGTITTCDDNIVAGIGDNGFVVVTSGTLNGDGTIELEWTNDFGDSGIVLLTPVP